MQHLIGRVMLCENKYLFPSNFRFLSSLLSYYLFCKFLKANLAVVNFPPI
jgi:hypothetical protein